MRRVWPEGSALQLGSAREATCSANCGILPEASGESASFMPGTEILAAPPRIPPSFAISEATGRTSSIDAASAPAKVKRTRPTDGQSSPSGPVLRDCVMKVACLEEPMRDGRYISVRALGIILRLLAQTGGETQPAPWAAGHGPCRIRSPTLAAKPEVSWPVESIDTPSI